MFETDKKRERETERENRKMETKRGREGLW